jgi:hypothetical protein
MEYRLRAHDGTYRWVLACGTPRYGSDGASTATSAAAFDITEQKEAEQHAARPEPPLDARAGRERRRIARELHDHLSQQLALLAVDLQQLAIKRCRRATRSPLQEAWRRTTEIASDVHAISHRLHPSKMEALGLVATAQAHCRDISRRACRCCSRTPMCRPAFPGSRAERLPHSRGSAQQRAAPQRRDRGARHRCSAPARTSCCASRTTAAGSSRRGASRRARTVSMRERLQLLEGTLSTHLRAGQGTVVEARMPIAGARPPAPAAPASPCRARARRDAGHQRVTLPDLHS